MFIVAKVGALIQELDEIADAFNVPIILQAISKMPQQYNNATQM